MRRRGRKGEIKKGCIKRMRRWDERVERIRMGDVVLGDTGSGNSGRRSGFRLVNYVILEFRLKVFI